jgi:hypothetical protein
MKQEPGTVTCLAKRIRCCCAMSWVVAIAFFCLCGCRGPHEGDLGWRLGYWPSLTPSPTPTAWPGDTITRRHSPWPRYAQRHAHADGYGHACAYGAATHADVVPAMPTPAR